MSEHDMPVTSYIDLLGFMESRHSDKRNAVPAQASIELTFRCNYRCAHCYNNLPGNDAEAKKRELTTNEVYQIIDQLVEEGTMFLLLTGGEALLRPDFMDILRYSKRRGLLTAVYTNGSLINDRLADDLGKYPPYRVEITLYGATRETYDRVTGNPGSFEKCMRGIRLLLERGVQVLLKAMILTWTVDEIDRMKEFAEGMGMTFKCDPYVNPRLDGDPKPLDVRISPQQVVEAELKYRGAVQAIDRREETVERASKKGLNDALYTCGYGRGTLHIDPYGRLTGCMLSRKHYFSLRAGAEQSGYELHDKPENPAAGSGIAPGSFRKAYYEFLSGRRALRVATPEAWQRSPERQWSEQCVGQAELETDDAESKVAWFTEIGNTRKALSRKGSCDGCSGGCATI